MKNLQIKETVLTKLQRAVFFLISEEEAYPFIEDPEVNISNHHLGEGILIRVTQCMLGHDVESIEVRYPADWIEAFKNRFFQGWLRKKFPIKYIKETMIKTVVYPDLVIPDRGDKITYLHTEKE